MHTFKHTLSFSLILAAVACCLRAEEPKKEEPAKPVRQQLKADRLVSDNAFLYFSTPDFKKARAAFERSAFRSLLREEEVAKPLLDTYATLRDAYVRGDGTRTESEVRRRGDEVDLLMRLAPLLDGQVAVALEGDASMISSLAHGTLPKFLLIASLPLGEEGDKRQQLIEAVMEKHRSAQGVDGRFKDTDDRVGNYDVVRIENSELKLFEGWAFVENLFIYGSGKRMVEDAIERFNKNSAGALARHEGYQSIYDQVGRDDNKDAAVYLQIDVRPLLSSFSSAYPALKAVLDPKLGAMEANRPHFGMGVFVGEGDNAAIREKMFVRMAKDAMPKKYGPCANVTARFAQSDTVFYSGMQTSLVDIYNDVLASLKAQGGENRDVALQEKLKQAFAVQNAAEIQAKLELFKGEAGVLLSYVPKPDLKMDHILDYFDVLQPVFIFELDPDNAVADTTLKTLLKSIETATGHEYIQTTAGTTPVFYQRGAAPREEKAANMPNGLAENLFAESEGAKVPFFAAYARVDVDLEAGRQRKFLLVSDHLNALRKAVQQSQAQHSRTTLAEEKKFKDLAKLFRESRSSISYLELSKLLEVYAVEMPKLSKSGIIGRDTLQDLPSPNALRDHLFPMAWASSVINDPGGVLIECSSPLGNLPLVGVMGTVAWPAIVSRRQQAISDEVDENFKRIMLGLHLYAADFDRFPPQLSDLYNYVKKDLKVFESPFKRGALKGPQDIDNPDLTNIIYVPSRAWNDLGEDIILYEKDPTKLVKTRDGYKLFHHVLTLDGKNRPKPKASLERALAGKVDLPSINSGDPAVQGSKKK
ncbi:MAG TPA: hypothetical protein VEK08_20610 [Planctomycetota bacterium]|nr:hypothetical protein [Planctomycetota bacterium]